jgi:hypothetical protein
MNLWLAAAVSLVCALVGMLLGKWFSGLRRPYWTIGFVLPLVLTFVYALTFPFPGIMFRPPLSWMMMGIKKFASLGFIAAMLLTTPLSRVPGARGRLLIALLIGVSVFYLSVWPFIAPMLDRGQLSRLHTTFDQNGICLQGTGYTCGPAAAVTALRKLHLPAEEGQIGIISCTSDLEGTPPDMLAEGLKKEYVKDGLQVQCRVFNTVGELKHAGLTLAIIKYGFLEDHWVTVLDVTDTEVVVGDPLSGLTRLTYEDFSKRWRFIGVVLQRKLPALGGPAL